MKRRALLVAVAVALALVGTFAVFSYTRSANNRAVAGTKATQVLIAAKRVPAGTSWSDAVAQGYLKSETIPAATEPESAITSPAASGVTGTEVAAADISAGQIVLRPMFGTQTATTGPISLPAGDIAISVTVAGNADVAGFPQPGSQVAIFATYQVPNTAGPKLLGTTQYLTKMLLPKVLVTAASAPAPTTTTGTGATSSGSVLLTLGVSQAQAEQVILAQQAGQLYFSLLSASSKTGADAGTTNSGTTQPTPLVGS
jgi:Flp pilus assembly protein CpaB